MEIYIEILVRFTNPPVRWKLTDCSVLKWSQFTLSQLRLGKAAKNEKGQKSWKLTCKRNVSKEEIKIVEMKCKNFFKRIVEAYDWILVIVALITSFKSHYQYMYLERYVLLHKKFSRNSKQKCRNKNENNSFFGCVVIIATMSRTDSVIR